MDMALTIFGSAWKKPAEKPKILKRGCRPIWMESWKPNALPVCGQKSGYQVETVSRIVHSGKKRARETAEILAAILSPTDGLESRTGMNPLDDVRALAGSLDLDKNIMLVGHLPFLERLIGLLVCDNPDQTVFKLQNSGILCLDRVPEVKNPVIRWALMPSVG
jgi:phosphohistidine phosphatase